MKDSKTSNPAGKVEKKKTYGRIEDMSWRKKLNLYIHGDGDVVLFITDSGVPVDNSEVEFCQSGAGGGRSPHVRKALFELMLAMEKDNAEHPIDDPW